MIFDEIKNKYIISYSIGGLVKRVPQFFSSILEAKKYFITEIGQNEIDNELPLDSQFKLMKENYEQCGYMIGISIKTVEDELNGFEYSNDYDPDGFRNREEYIKCVFDGFRI